MVRTLGSSANLALRSVGHQNLVRLQAGNRFEAAFGDRFAQPCDRAEITVAGRFAGQLAGEVLTKYVRRGADNFVGRAGSVETCAKNCDGVLNLLRKIRHAAL